MLRSTLLAGLALTLGATPALARDWSYVTTNGRGTIVAVANASFQRSGDRISGLFRFRDRRGNEMYRHVSIDCRLRTIGDALAAGPADRVVPQGIGHHMIVDGSIGAYMAGTMCQDYGADYAFYRPAGPETYMPPPVIFSNPGATPK